jgi:hypothetical protein
VDGEETGWLISRQSVDELRRAIGRAAAEDLDEKHIAARAQRFSAARFRREIHDAVVSCLNERHTGARPIAPEVTG